jgi:hypothetical protein
MPGGRRSHDMRPAHAGHPASDAMSEHGVKLTYDDFLLFPDVGSGTS